MCELPHDPNRRADMRVREAWTRERLAELADLGAWDAAGRADWILEDAGRLPPPRELSVLVHGDLHFRHVLVHGGRLSAVLDWGDVALGDRSLDLLLVWSLLMPEGRRRFLVEYGPVDEAAWLRARVLSLFLCATLALQAHHEGRENVHAEAVAGLERTLVD